MSESIMNVGQCLSVYWKINVKLIMLTSDTVYNDNPGYNKPKLWYEKGNTCIRN